MRWGPAIARFLVPEEFILLEKQKSDMQMEVNRRVADVLLQMDPFEPFLKKYNVIFSEKYGDDAKPENELSSIEALRLVMWAYGVKNDPSFIHLTDFIRNKQGNATLRKGRNDHEWFFGRAALVTITLLVDEVGRLASKYEEVLRGRDESFDKNLPVGEY